MNDQISVDDVLLVISKRAQWCRENGESDMRNILNTVRMIKTMISEGKSGAELLEMFSEEDDEN